MRQPTGALRSDDCADRMDVPAGDLRVRELWTVRDLIERFGLKRPHIAWLAFGYRPPLPVAGRIKTKNGHGALVFDPVVVTEWLRVHRQMSPRQDKAHT